MEIYPFPIMIFDYWDLSLILWIRHSPHARLHSVLPIWQSDILRLSVENLHLNSQCISKLLRHKPCQLVWENNSVHIWQHCCNMISGHCTASSQCPAVFFGLIRWWKNVTIICCNQIFKSFFYPFIHCTLCGIAKLARQNSKNWKWSKRAYHPIV